MPLTSHDSHHTGDLSETEQKGSLATKIPFDPLRIVDAISRKLWLCLLAGLIAGGAGLTFGLLRFRDEYGAAAQLMRQEPPNAFRASESGENFRPRTLTPQTVISLARSPRVLEKVSEAVGGTLTNSALMRGLSVISEKNTDLLRLEFITAASPNKAVDVVNAYAEQVAELTRYLQADEARTINRFLKQQIARADEELRNLQAEALAYGREAQLLNADKEMDAYLRQLGDISIRYESTRIDFETIGLKIGALEGELAKHSVSGAKLQSAREELANMLTRYTDQHPAVVEQRAKITHLEAEFADPAASAKSVSRGGESPVADSLTIELVSLRAQQKVLGEQVRQLEQVRSRLNAKLAELPEKEGNLNRIKARQRMSENAREMLAVRQREAELFAENALGYYRVMATAELDDVSTYGRTKKIAIVTLGAAFAVGGLLALYFGWRGVADARIRTGLDLRRVTGLELLASLPASVVHLHERQTWAFRTWTTLRQRLVTVEDGLVCGWLAPSSKCLPLWLDLLGGAASERGSRVLLIAGFDHDTLATVEEALADPERIVAALDSAPLGRIGIPHDWAWTSARRQSWLRALSVWRKANLVVLMEVTGPGEPESVLLAETLPHIVCLARSGELGTDQMASIIAPYREAGCALLGAALDQTPSLSPRWLSDRVAPLLAATIVLAGIGAPSSQAAAPPAPAKAAWAERLTLGPGDSVNISLYRQPEFNRTDVYIDPDGRLTYLTAREIQAAGLTIDELRESLRTELAKTYRDPRVIVTPAAFQSKRVYIMGKVVDKGAIFLDRPMTILEAVASAHGLEVGLYMQNTVELADLPRSLLVRGGKRMKVDFEKLFLHGDLSQNVYLEPEDYLYFPSSSSNDFYVFGAVRNPGTQGLTTQASVVSALSVAGSFTPRAWKERVLVVRGSFDKPQTFVVDFRAIISGQRPDFRLEPRDLVYVADRPWAKAEELLEGAIAAFTQAAVATWTGANVGPLITRPLLPSP